MFYSSIVFAEQVLIAGRALQSANDNEFTISTTCTPPVPMIVLMHKATGEIAHTPFSNMRCGIPARQAPPLCDECGIETANLQEDKTLKNYCAGCFLAYRLSLRSLKTTEKGAPNDQIEANKAPKKKGRK